MQRLIACGVQDIPSNAEEANNFGFTAEDIGDYIFDVLQFYGLDFEAIEFMSGDNAYINQSLCTKIEDWLRREKQINHTVPLVGCASHRLNLASTGPKASFIIAPFSIKQSDPITLTCVTNP